MLYIRCVLWGVFFLSSSRPIAFRFVSSRCFVRPLVQLGFVSFRVDASRFVSFRVAASFVLSFSCVSFRFVSTRFVSFRVAASFVLSFSCVSFRSVSTRRGEKERNKQRKKQTNPNSYQPLAGPMNS